MFRESLVEARDALDIVLASPDLSPTAPLLILGNTIKVEIVPTKTTMLKKHILNEVIFTIDCNTSCVMMNPCCKSLTG